MQWASQGAARVTPSSYSAYTINQVQDAPPAAHKAKVGHCQPDKGEWLVGTHLRTLQRDARFVRYADRIQKHLTRSIQTHTQAHFFCLFTQRATRASVEKREKCLFAGTGGWYLEWKAFSWKALCIHTHWRQQQQPERRLHQEMISGQTRLHFMTLTPRKKVWPEVVCRNKCVLTMSDDLWPWKTLSARVINISLRSFVFRAGRFINLEISESDKRLQIGYFIFKNCSYKIWPG